jgi:hypothetical protein
MPIGSADDDRQRDATSVGQEVALGPHFFPGPLGSSRRTLLPVAPWSRPHRYFATPKQFPPSHRTQQVPNATERQTHLRVPTPETGCEWRLRSQRHLWEGPSTDSPYEEQTRCLQGPIALTLAYVHRLACACSLDSDPAAAMEAGAPLGSRRHPTIPSSPIATWLTPPVVMEEAGSTESKCQPIYG